MEIRDRSKAVQLGLALMLFGVFVLIAIWDMWCVFDHGAEMTVSSLVRSWSARWPILPFAAGMVAGHIWFGG